MPPVVRRFAPWLFAGLLLSAAWWALSAGTLPPADFTFCNGTEIKTIDPATVTGIPEGRVVAAIYEPLCGRDPATLKPIPGVAERWEISPDLKTYTFHLRADARWSDGSPLTAEDFRYSFRRFLAPETQGEYAYQLWYVKNAARYSKQKPEVGERVEVELPRAEGVPNTVRGPLLEGVLKAVGQVGETKVHQVEVAGRIRKFAVEPPAADVERCTWVLPHFDLVGIRVDGPRKLLLELENPTPFFLDIVAFYPLSPVHRASIEQYGAPQWTRPEHLVSNGAFRIELRRIRDRVRLVKNEHYWNRDAVKLNTIDVLAVEGATTMLNLYMTGEADWITDVPTPIAPQLITDRPQEFSPTPMLGTYFYRFNTKRKPFSDPRVRKAMTIAINRKQIVETVARMGQKPAFSLVPPGMAGYEPARCAPENVAEAKRLLAEAGFPDGRGFPKFEILYNTQEAHKAIAELIQDQWKRNLGIDVGLRNQEWGAYQDTVRMFDYDTARASWIGDYTDPNTFLDMFLTGGENNQTGWSNSEYDRLVKSAAGEANPTERLKLLRDAEVILTEALPILPIYYYVSRDMVRPYVRGFHPNVRDEHPLWAVSIDPDEKRRVLAAGAGR
jgi:oligopeptide transport system substrate-binding protein